MGNTSFILNNNRARLVVEGLKERLFLPDVGAFKDGEIHKALSLQVSFKR